MLILSFLEYTAIIIGAIAMASGKVFGLLKAYHLGIFLIGAGITLGGFESVFRRQIRFPSFFDRRDAYAGVPAVIWGLMVLLAGTAVIAMAYLLADGRWTSVLGFLQRRLAVAMILPGLLVAGAGALVMFDPHGWRGIWQTLLVRVPRLILGLMLVTLGLAAGALGAWDWFAPRSFQHFAATMATQLDWHGWGRFWTSLPGWRR